MRAARIAAFAFPRPSHAKTRRNGREKGVLKGEAFAFGLRFPPLSAFAFAKALAFGLRLRHLTRNGREKGAHKGEGVRL